jgi:hypothetical protein
MNDREFSIQKFVTRFLEETVRRAIDDAAFKLTRVEEYGQQSPCLLQKTQSKSRVVSVDETVRTLGLKPATIRSWNTVRKMSSVRFGRRVMVPLEAIENILEGGLIPALKQK